MSTAKILSQAEDDMVGGADAGVAGGADAGGVDGLKCIVGVAVGYCEWCLVF